MSINTPPTNTFPDQPPTPNHHDPFITPNRIYIATQTQEGDPLELLTRAIAMTEAEDYLPTIAEYFIPSIPRWYVHWADPFCLSHPQQAHRKPCG